MLHTAALDALLHKGECEQCRNHMLLTNQVSWLTQLALRHSEQQRRRGSCTISFDLWRLTKTSAVIPDLFGGWSFQPPCDASCLVELICAHKRHG